MKKVPLKSAAGDSPPKNPNQKPTKLNPLKPLSGQDQLHPVPNLKPVETTLSGEDVPMPPVKPKETDKNSYFIEPIYSSNLEHPIKLSNFIFWTHDGSFNPHP